MCRSRKYCYLLSVYWGWLGKNHVANGDGLQLWVVLVFISNLRHPAKYPMEYNGDGEFTDSVCICILNAGRVWNTEDMITSFLFVFRDIRSLADSGVCKSHNEALQVSRRWIISAVSEFQTLLKPATAWSHLNSDESPSSIRKAKEIGANVLTLWFNDAKYQPKWKYLKESCGSKSFRSCNGKFAVHTVEVFINWFFITHFTLHHK